MCYAGYWVCYCEFTDKFAGLNFFVYRVKNEFVVQIVGVLVLCALSVLNLFRDCISRSVGVLFWVPDRIPDRIRIC